MENDDTSTMTPVQASNASAALPGASGGSGAPASAGGASAAYGGASTVAPVAAPVSQPYDTMTTPTALNIPTPRPRPFAGPNPRARQDVVNSPAFGARGASEMQIEPWMARSKLTEAQETAVRTEAGRLGIAPSTLAAVMDYETIGTFDTDIQGGTGGNYRGLIQFGPTERKMYGYRDGMTFEEQLAGPVHNYLVGRGVKPGHGIAEVYSIINAGSLKNGAPRWGASDRTDPKTGRKITVRDHVNDISRHRLPRYSYLDEDWTPPSREVDIPNPRLRPASDDPALGAAGARSMPEVIPGSPSAAYGPLPAAEPMMTLPALSAAINTDRIIVERGVRGDPVRDLQTFLNDRGYTDAAGRPLAVDGDYGRRTKEAVKAFQSASQIEVDGRVGPETLSAVLFTIDPTSSPMPGQVAYADGANAAQKIIDPTAPEVAIPLPRPRPERGEGVPNPRMRPGQEQAQPAQWSEADDMTLVDENGNYVNAPPADAPRPPAPAGRGVGLSDRDTEGRPSYGPAEVGRLASDFRQKLLSEGWADDKKLAQTVTAFETAARQTGSFRYASGLSAADIGRVASDIREGMIKRGEPPEVVDRATVEIERMMKANAVRAQRVSAATSAGRGATRQRLSGMVPSTDRFRPRNNARGDEIERVRVTEAVREYARGIADTYRRVADRGRTAPPPIATDPDRQRFLTDALMRAVPTPAETVTEAYAFRRRAVA